VAPTLDRAAAHYDGSLPPLRQLNVELLERLSYFALEPQCVLELGAGRCQTALTLRRRFPKAQVLALDLSLTMLQGAPRGWWPRARFHRVASDAARLPLREHSVDLVYSSLLWPLCDRPEIVFRELARVLTPGGLFVFATLGPRTLTELRCAWQGADDHEHVGSFPNLPQLGDALMQSGLVEPVMDTEEHRLNFPHVSALLRQLKQLGAQNAASARPRGLTGRKRFQAMAAAYESVRTAAGLPATFELIFGAAFAGAGAIGRGPRGLESGEVAVPVSSLRTHSPSFRR
jgi:malonyl-CoA O-methyltransferase